MAIQTIDVEQQLLNSNVITRLRPLIDPEVTGVNKFTHYVEIKAGNIPAGIPAGDTLAVNFGKIYKYNRVNNVCAIMQQGFQNADTGFISVMLDFGDIGDPDGYITQAQVCGRAGGLIKTAWKTGVYTVPKDYTVDTVIQWALTPTAAKSLSNLLQGSVIILLDLFKFPAPIDTDSA